MQIKYVSVPVDDQAKALDFYTRVLGFEKAADVEAGGYRWLTVTSPDGAPGVELLLEPMSFQPAVVYQKALHDAGMPVTQFVTDDIDAEAARLKELGVTFHTDVQDMGPVRGAVIDDTCGNLIQIIQPA